MSTFFLYQNGLLCLICYNKLQPKQNEGHQFPAKEVLYRPGLHIS